MLHRVAERLILMMSDVIEISTGTAETPEEQQNKRIFKRKMWKMSISV